MHVSFVFKISCDNCIISFVIDFHTLKPILPFFIKMILNYYYRFAFHVLLV